MDIIAPKVLDKIMENSFGIAHVGSDRKTVYDIACERKKNVKAISRSDVGISVPYDTSFSD